MTLEENSTFLLWDPTVNRLSCLVALTNRNEVRMEKSRFSDSMVFLFAHRSSCFWFGGSSCDFLGLEFLEWFSWIWKIFDVLSLLGLEFLRISWNPLTLLRILLQSINSRVQQVHFISFRCGWCLWGIEWEGEWNSKTERPSKVKQ